jgi:hypothetical protein
MDEKRAYLSSLPQNHLIDLLLTASNLHSDLPIFPPNIQNLSTIPSQQTPAPQPYPQQSTQYQAPPPFHPTTSTTSPQNGHTPGLDDSAEPQGLGESHQNLPRTTIDLAGNQYEEDDGYDTDPPAHYPKAGNGLARTLRPESEDLNWLVDDNFEVFSHSWKGDGTGLAADGSLDGMGQKVA